MIRCIDNNNLKSGRVGVDPIRPAFVVLRLVALVVLGLSLGSCQMVFSQNKMVYRSRQYTEQDLAKFRPGTVPIVYTTKHGPQRSYYVPPRDGTIPDHLWVVFSGQNGTAADWARFCHDFPDERTGFLLIDYPSYGANGGHPSKDSIRGGADAAYAALSEQLGLPTTELDARLGVMGHSLGTATALEWSRGKNVKSVLLLAPFTSLRAMARLRVGPVLCNLLYHDYDNRKRLEELARRGEPPQVMILHAEADARIPVEMSRELAREFPALVTYQELPGGDHVVFFDEERPKVFAAMTGGFNKSVIAPTPSAAGEK